VVQRVPPGIYKASYPCWIFSRERLLESFGEDYKQLAFYTDGSGPWETSGVRFDFAGFLLECAR